MKKIMILIALIGLGAFNAFGSDSDDFEGNGPYKQADGDWGATGNQINGHDVYGCESSTAVCFRAYENGAFVAYSGGGIVLVGDWYSIEKTDGTGSVAWSDLDEVFDGANYELVVE